MFAILLLAIVLAAGCAVLVMVLGPYRERRRAELAADWEGLLFEQRRLAGRGLHLIQVVNVYQRARRGSKAIVVWCDTGAQQDAWFDGVHIPAGTFCLVSKQTGYGPHNDNPNVLYVYPRHLHASAPAAAYRAWTEIQARTTNPGGRLH